MIFAFLQHHTIILILMGTGFLGICAGVLGCFALLRESSLFGDTMAHAALPGIAAMFLCTGSKNPAVLLLGGMLSSTLGAYMITWIRTTTRLKPETILATILSLFFGTGLVLMTIMQRTCSADQAILGKFLFGNAALLLTHEVCAIIGASCAVLLCIWFFWKELKLFTFDQTLAHALGYSPTKLDIVLTFLMITMIGIGLQTVGVILITTLLIAPAAAARQWSSQLSSMAFLSALFGACSACMGTLVSYQFEQIPTGPAIVVTATGFAFISVIIRSIMESKSRS